MHVIQIDKFAFRVPELPARYRANCSKDWGCFVHGDTKGLNSAKAEKAGLTKGDFVEMALCDVHSRVLTFEPHYINEEFVEIWGIPTAGQMKFQFPEQASELSTFLLHRRSKDNLGRLLEVFSKGAFMEWVNNGMKGDPNSITAEKIQQAQFEHIFRFEFVNTEGSYGPYYFLEITEKQPETDLEKAALEAAKQLAGTNFCTDPMLIENDKQCRNRLSATQNALPEGGN